MVSTPGWTFYQRQLDYLRAKNVDGLIEAHYDDDAVLISFDRTVRGHDALKDHFRGYLEMLGDLVVESTDKFTETDDAIFLEATVTSNLGGARVYDAFVLRDGKISHHFTGVIGSL